MLISYACVSKADGSQSLDLQRAAPAATTLFPVVAVAGLESLFFRRQEAPLVATTSSTTGTRSTTTSSAASTLGANPLGNGNVSKVVVGV